MAKAAPKRAGGKALFGLKSDGVLARAKSKVAGKGTPRLWIAGKKAPPGCPAWLFAEMKKPGREKRFAHWTDDAGPHWVVAPLLQARQPGAGATAPSDYARFRDTVGLAIDTDTTTTVRSFFCYACTEHMFFVKS